MRKPLPTQQVSRHLLHKQPNRLRPHPYMRSIQQMVNGRRENSTKSPKEQTVPSYLGRGKRAAGVDGFLKNGSVRRRVHLQFHDRPETKGTITVQSIPHDSVRVAGLVPGVGFSPIECIVLSVGPTRASGGLAQI